MSTVESVWDDETVKSSSLKSDVVVVSHCGTPFVNGTYMRVAEKQYSRRVKHPGSGELVTLELGMVNLQSTFNPGLSPFKPEPAVYEFRRYAWVEDPNTRYFDQALVLRMTRPTEVHYYVCANDGAAKHWRCIAGLGPTPRLSPVPNARHYFVVPYYSDSMADGLAETVQTHASEERSLALKRPDKKYREWHRHFLKKRKPVYTTLVALSRGLQGAQAFCIDANQKWTVWQLLREIADMNSTKYNALSPFRVRLKCIDNKSGFERSVHFQWRMTLAEVIEMTRKESLALYLSETSARHSAAASAGSGRLALPMERSKVKPFGDFIESYKLLDGSFSFQSRWHPCFEYDSERNAEQIEKRLREKQEKRDASKRSGFRIKAIRVWGITALRLRFGSELVTVNLEQCSAACSCWTDELCGQRLAYLIEAMFQIPRRKQGFVISNEIVDNLTPEFGAELSASDFQLVVFENF